MKKTIAYYANAYARNEGSFKIINEELRNPIKTIQRYLMPNETIMIFNDKSWDRMIELQCQQQEQKKSLIRMNIVFFFLWSIFMFVLGLAGMAFIMTYGG